MVSTFYRVLPLLDALQQAGPPASLSIDTRHAAVAAAALQRGVRLVNDVSALDDPAMAAVVAAHDAELILMHMRGSPADMQRAPAYADVVQAVRDFWQQRRDRARQAGIATRRLIFDPGLGFGKTLRHNLQLLTALPQLARLGAPVCVGPSRKAFLGELTGHRQPAQRDAATAAVVALAIAGGASLVRVHNVAAVRDAVRVACAWRATLQE